ncbi:diaminobutyrate--2-oxoglutarate transaminase [Paraburkholderia sp. Tr-20389]|uniref:diaminobutyrate--2-oxoglutarate transaminase n=1 Tax=Paraburkholderia sp. Tr-20389 TaxID=2703903 RepID=UPI001980B505|nr:diaminobutyrate--2-oxoglutarate transaminase [Paraburkholderia sp. Tr-20389]MBN3753274.1 diaminobutyrate--2-oxoglutarate transaminase [Paraburkholderia sp. Tr-20389]
MSAVERIESNVRSYSRGFPTVFSTAKGALLYDEAGNAYVDLLAGAGSVNYGHNDARIKDAVVEYLLNDGVVQGLDLATTAKVAFLRDFARIVLGPRGMDYRIQFTGPTGTNAVEAALKLARKATGRTVVASFTNGFHGVSLGALAATGNDFKRSAAGVSLNDVVRLPFDCYIDGNFDSIAYARQLFGDPSSGYAKPAAFIVETVQGEGGLNVASEAWLRGLQALATELGALLIIDDIQAGCGRTGTFFSFERFGIQPDVICLSKSIGGNGLPMAIVLIAPKYDIWAPGEHNGTFRGNNLAFVAARAALSYWEDAHFLGQLDDNIQVMDLGLEAVLKKHPKLLVRKKGRGLFQGIEFARPEDALRVRAAMFDRAVVMEMSGPRGEVLKLMPPLTIPATLLERTIKLIDECIASL